jgi:uncharacterized protein (TIGR02466 family)
MQLLSIFSNFLVLDTLTLDNSSIIEYTKKVCDKSNYEFDETDDIMNPLYSVVEYNLNKVHAKIGLGDNYHQVIRKAWINPSIVRPTAVPHNHPSYCLSAVYFVSCSENSGDLMFLNPNQQHTQVIPSTLNPDCIKEYNHINSAVWRYKPIAGTLLIFPSWLFHYVESGDGTERISVAFDAKLERKHAIIS